MDNTRLEPFKMQNLPLVVDVVEPLWFPPVGDKEFKRFNVEYIDEWKKASGMSKTYIFKRKL